MILKMFDWSVDVKYNIARLISKSIESSMDYPLRSLAIQGITPSD